MDDLSELQAELGAHFNRRIAEGLTCEANTLHLQGEHRNCVNMVPATWPEVSQVHPRKQRFMQTAPTTVNS